MCSSSVAIADDSGGGACSGQYWVSDERLVVPAEGRRDDRLANRVAAERDSEEKFPNPDLGKHDGRRARRPQTARGDSPNCIWPPPHGDTVELAHTTGTGACELVVTATVYGVSRPTRIKIGPVLRRSIGGAGR